jgi:hypothetical protein
MNCPADGAAVPETPAALRVAIVGVGPRGLSVLERIIENVRVAVRRAVVVELFEPGKFGSGDVWRTNQSSHLVMNIIASQITVFADDTVQMTGPVRKGPSLHEWSTTVAVGEHDGHYPTEVLEESAQVDENSYCRRSFYGHYLEWAYREVKRRCPGNVEIREHHRRVVAVHDTDHGSQTVRCDDGHTCEVDQLVMAIGHGPMDLVPEEKSFRDFAHRTGAVYHPPGNPADADLDGIEPAQPVLIRGLGLSLFDYLSLLTSGRGGRYVRTGRGLGYVRSGLEPRIVCGSRRGIPLHGRADNEKGNARHEPVFLTVAAVERLRHAAGCTGALDFRRDCWPLIAKEVETAYYTRLVACLASEAHAREFHALYRAIPWSSAAEPVALRKFRIPARLRWDWAQVARPYTDRDLLSVPCWRRFVRSYLMRDVCHARLGNLSSAVKCALDVLRDIRNELRYLINGGGIEGDSYRTDVDGWFNSLHAFLSLGPPRTRIEELVALLDADVVEVAGPGFSVAVDDGSGMFVGRSVVPGDVSESSVLVDARLPRVDLALARNPLLVHLRQCRQITRFSVPKASGGRYVTGGVAVTGRPFRAVRPDGSVHPARYVFGVPTEGANWVTETGVRPHVNSITMGDSDSIARAVLGLPS